jgi:hypothetical protein
LLFFACGHTSDFLLIAAQNSMRALCKWKARNSEVEVYQDASFMKLLGQAMTCLNCQYCHIVGVGRYTFAGSVWSLDTPVAWCDRLGHNFRSHWGVHKVAAWLQSKRLDAKLARELPLVVTAQLVERLHVACRHFNGHATSVMAGGLVSEAKWQSKTKCRFGFVS